MPSTLPASFVPSSAVGVQPVHLPLRINSTPSRMRRGTPMIPAIARSAVSSVKTPGVLVTRIWRSAAA